MKSLVLLFTLAIVAFGQAPRRDPYLIPPPGVVVAEADQRQLKAGLDRLAKRLLPLAGRPHLEDAQIFHKAVRYAVEGGEFFAADDVFKAKELLRLGNERAAELERGSASWATATGLQVRGYVSKLDGSVQPYGLVVPSTYGPEKPHKWRVDAWFHGRSETLSEVNFLWDRMHNAGQFTPRDTIVLHLYGRYCNASTFAGEVDFFEALADVKKHFNVDDNRILVRGFSMGGASAWHIGAHYGTDFAAVAPGAGFSETKDFFGYTRRNVKLTWFEEKLLHLTNATDYAVNFFNVPVVAYNGDKDGQKQAADIMATNMEAEGMTLSRIIGKDIGHAYTPESIVQINEKMDALAQRGRQLFPREVRFTTWTLKFNRMRWVVVDGLEKHWDRARVTAVVESDKAVKATTAGVTALSFDMGAGSPLLNPANRVTVTLDGQALTVPGAQSDGSWLAHFTKANGKWAIGSADPSSLSKRHDLQGPLDDAFMDAFLNVRPTGTPMNEMAGKWAASEMDHAAKLWRTQMRGDAPAKDDTAITDADIANSNLVLWGDPQSNKVLARVVAKLPIQWTADSITLGTSKFPSATHAPIMIYPNPLNPKKYVVINSGITFREYAEPNNSLQIAYLPDYAVVDLTTPPDLRWPGKIALAGFFGEKWELLPGDGK